MGSRPGTECGDPDQSLAMWPRLSCMTFQTWIFWGEGEGWRALFIAKSSYGTRQQTGRGKGPLVPPTHLPQPGALAGSSRLFPTHSHPCGRTYTRKALSPATRFPRTSRGSVWVLHAWPLRSLWQARNSS